MLGLALGSLLKTLDTDDTATPAALATS
jgi:hypothetical protein